MSIKRKCKVQSAKFKIVIAVVFAPFVFAGSVFAVGIDATDFNYLSWGENVGWFNWGTAEGDVDVGSSELTGYVWSENLGWVSLNCSDTSSCGTVDYKVERDGSEFSGYAWGENVGWISFSCENTASCGTVDYSVSYDPSDGEFLGYAWGENVGWIVMNCSTTASCGTVDYRVRALVQADGGGGGGCPGPEIIGYASECWCATNSSDPLCAPTPTATPTVSPSPIPPAPFAPITAPIVAPPPAISPEVSPPPASPLPAVPTEPPPSVPGAPGVIDRIGRGIDDVSERIGRFIDRGLNRPVESLAGIFTAIALVPLLWAAFEIVRVRSVGAVAYFLLQALGLKKKARVWGTVYDSRTKHPLAFARVQILDEANRVLENRFADRDGRYGFLLRPPSPNEPVVKVRIVAAKQDYAFPSKEVGSGTDFVVYEHVYLGEMIEASSDTALTYDIPMDPVAVEGRPARPPFAAVIGRTWETILNIGFYAGLILVPYNMILHPTTANLMIGVVFFGANAFRVLKIYRPYGHIKDVASGQTVPFSLVTLHDESGKRLSFAVSDEVGRYFLSTHGVQDYQVRIHTPANVIPPRSTVEDIPSRSKHVRRGWITKNMKV